MTRPVPPPMASIVRVSLSEGPADAGFWPRAAARSLAWSQAHGLRDCVVLVPFAQLLAPARRAFAGLGGWQPRIETTQTLARSLAPPPPLRPGQVSFDGANDRLQVAAMLERSGAASGWLRRDRRAFEQAVAACVETAHAMVRRLHAVPPDARSDWLASARTLLAGMSGPGQAERLLARVALEWAALSDSAATDVLFSLQPAAWIVLQAGGEDALSHALIERSRGPALVLDTDGAPERPFDAAVLLAPPRRFVCGDFEAEAHAAAHEVLAAVAHDRVPVALIAHDRMLIRRVRALLERAGASLHDETGWTLSTTRAAARVMALLRAAHPTAGPDACLDWLKAEGAGGPLGALEARWRRGAAARDDAVDAWWQAQHARLQPLRAGGTRALQAWLADLREAVDMNALNADEAGRQVLTALRLDAHIDDDAWDVLAGQTTLDLDGFTTWVDGTLEQSAFVPSAAASPDVVVTPLARALLRPFAAVVFPGTDELRLGAPARATGLLGDAEARALGLPDAAARRLREALAFAHVLRLADVVLLRRRSEGNEPLAASALVQRAALARARAGLPAWTETSFAPIERSVDPAPMAPPLPRAPAALPASLSASAVDALRDCPYRFFARVQLGLGEAAELETALEKRDYGTWLHAVLHRFHGARGAPAAAETEVQAVLACADALQDEMGLDAAELLPYRSALDRLAPMYVAWLHERDTAGWQWHEGEVERRIAPQALAGTGLHGRIDRIDRRGKGFQLIDYKTGSANALETKVASALEDTQLAFYAALALHEAPPGTPVEALYLALDERKGPQEIVHEDVAATASQLIEGLADDLAQVRAGAPLPALGAGRVCDWCEARGLCRRDHWSDDSE